MKRTDITRIIREEIVKALRGELNEAFADPIAAKLAKLSRKSKYDSPTFDALARKYDIEWDKVPAGSFQDITGDKRAAKTGLVFYVSEREERTGPGYGQQIQPGLLAVTLDGKILRKSQSSFRRGSDKPDYGQRFYKANRASVTIDKTRSTQDIGQAVRGTMQFNKLVDLADKMYRFDLESFRGGTTALKAKRVELKAGDQTYTDPKKYARANKDRYEKILRNRVGSKDQVDSLVKNGIAIVNKAVTDAFSLTKMNQYNELVTDVNGKEIKVTDLTYLMNKIIDRYSRYMMYTKSAESDRSADSTREGYYSREAKNTALEIKQIVNALKAGKV